MEDAFSRPTEDVLKHFHVSPHSGLSLDDVKRNWEKYGPNGKCVMLFIFKC